MSIQSRFGFEDADLKTPKHDEIMMWLDASIGKLFPKYECRMKTWEFPIKKSNGYIIGFADLVTDGNTRKHFEVKTTIPSLGELIRQIRMYECHPFYVVSPDTRFVDQIVSQNIGFIEYPTGKITVPL